MRSVLVILIMFFNLKVLSQEQSNYKEISSKFIAFYNESDYSSLFNLFNEEMKSAFPLKEVKVFFEEMKDSRGIIEQMRFHRTREDKHIYRTIFYKITRDVLISLDDNGEINELYFWRDKPHDLPDLDRNTTKMILPFKGEWFVYWGGTTVAQNYHVEYETQKYAYDILKVANGAPHDGKPEENESYYAYGQDIIAPCDATVVSTITGIHDNVPGKMNPKQLTGNTIVLRTKNNEYLLFAHLKANSIVVKKNDEVKQGQLLGQCGNSGNTTEPHLHLSLQNVEEMDLATGARLFFDRILVNGEIREDYLPVKEDFIKNIN